MTNLRVTVDDFLAADVPRAVAGSSLLTSVEHTVRSSGPTSYANWRNVLAFIDALLFHDELYVLGPAPEIPPLLERWRAMVGADLKIFVIDDIGLSGSTRESLNASLRETSEKVLKNSFFTTFDRIARKPPTDRLTDDETAELRSKYIQGFCAKGAASPDGAAELGEHLVRRYRETRDSPGGQAAILHQLRLLAFVVLARRSNGTAVVEGSRIPISHLFQSRIGPLPAAAPLRYYRIVDSFVRTSVRTLHRPGEAKYIPAVAGAVLHSAGGRQSWADLLGSVYEHKNVLADFRGTLYEYERDIADPAFSRESQLRKRNELVGSIRAHVEKFADQVGLPAGSWLDTLLASSLQHFQLRGEPASAGLSISTALLQPLAKSVVGSAARSTLAPAEALHKIIEWFNKEGGAERAVQDAWPIRQSDAEFARCVEVVEDRLLSTALAEPVQYAVDETSHVKETE